VQTFTNGIHIFSQQKFYKFNRFDPHCCWLYKANGCHQWRADVWWCPGRLLDCMPPYHILVLSSGVWWELLLDMRCLLHHTMTSFSRLQTNVLAKFVDTTCILFYTRSPYPLYNVSLQWMIVLSALQVRRPEQNTALSAKPEQFITAKISGNALKQGSTARLKLRQRSSQLQKYMAAHWKSGVEHTQRYDRAIRKCGNIRLRESLVE